MTTAAKPIPEGCHTVTPNLVVRGARRAIDFYRQAFGAQELICKTGPDGQTVMHAAVKIGDSMIFLSDEFPAMGTRSPETLGGSTAGIYLYVENVDALYPQALAAGARSVLAPTDMFWGDRFAKVVDPFGYEWALATHTEDLTPEEVSQREKAFFAQMGHAQS